MALLKGRALQNILTAIPDVQLTAEDADSYITPEVNQAISIPGVLNLSASLSIVAGQSTVASGLAQVSGGSGATAVLVLPLGRGLWRLSIYGNRESTTRVNTIYDTITLNTAAVSRVLLNMIRTIGFETFQIPTFQVLLRETTSIYLNVGAQGAGDECTLSCSVAAERLL